MKSYVFKSKYTINKSIKKAVKHATGKEMAQKLHAVGGTNLHEAVKRELSLHLSLKV